MHLFPSDRPPSILFAKKFRIHDSFIATPPQEMRGTLRAQSAFRAAQAKFSVLAGYQLLVRKKDQGERGTFYAAQVGPLVRSEANELCDNLRSAGASCFIERSLR